MFQCVLSRKPTCHAVRELQPYFQLPSIVWVSKRFGLLRFWKISFCATSWPSGLSKSWPIRVVASSWRTCFQLIYWQPRSETSELWKTKNTEQNQIDNVTHNQAAPLNAKWLNWTVPYNTLTPHPSTSQDNRVDWAQLNTTVTQIILIVKSRTCVFHMRKKSTMGWCPGADTPLWGGKGTAYGCQHDSHIL